jgi:hypothetical protein
VTADSPDLDKGRGDLQAARIKQMMMTAKARMLAYRQIGECS